MYAAKQKVSDAGAVAKEHADIFKAKAQEKAEKAAARTKEGKEIAKEVRKAKEAEAKMKMHEAKAQHLEQKLEAKHRPLFGHRDHHHHRHTPVGVVAPPAGMVAPGYPLGGQPPAPAHLK